MKKAWNKSNINLEEIKRMYVGEKMSALEISKKMSVGVGVIYSRLRELKITRSNSASHIGKRPSNYQGWYIEKRTGYKLIIIPRDSPFASMTVMNKETGTLYVREHRLVVAQNLGRPLESWEVVHHLNHNKLDNRLENLELISGQSRHHQETLSHNEMLRLKQENEIMKKIIYSCDFCRAALIAGLER